MLRCAVGGATPWRGLCIQNDSGRLQDVGNAGYDSGPQVTPRSPTINPTIAFSRAARKLLAAVWTLALVLLALAAAASWPPANPGAWMEARAAEPKPSEKQAASSMLARSGYAIAIAKDKLD
jgi:uncharacterized iron-regulated membrane protein